MVSSISVTLSFACLAFATARYTILTDAHEQWFHHGCSEERARTMDASDSTHVEVVDWSKSPQERGKDLVRALRKAGFAYISNHGIEHEVIDTAWEHAGRFFDASEDAGSFSDIIAVERQTLENIPLKTQRGYSDLYAEALNPYLGQDRKKSFDYALAIGSEPDGSESTHLGPNRWPKEDGADSEVDLGFKKAAVSYLDRTYSLSREVLHGVEIGLGLEAGSFDPFFDKPLVVNRYLLYPPQLDAESADEALAMGAGSHVDYGALTLIYQQDAGLEVLNNSTNDWHVVRPVDGTFVVGTGYMLERLTNGMVPASRHRVINRADAERMSFALFLDPNPSARISPMEKFVTPAHPEMFPPALAGHKGVVFSDGHCGDSGDGMHCTAKHL